MSVADVIDSRAPTTETLSPGNLVVPGDLLKAQQEGTASSSKVSSTGGSPQPRSPQLEESGTDGPQQKGSTIVNNIPKRPSSGSKKHNKSSRKSSRANLSLEKRVAGGGEESQGGSRGGSSHTSVSM